MAIREVRVDDLSGDAGAEPVRFTIEEETWVIDLVGGPKQLREALQRFIDAAEQLHPTRPDQAEPAVEPATDEPEPSPVRVDTAVDLSATERARCRQWGQQNAKRLNLDEPGNRGRLPAEIITAWVAAGRPTPSTTRRGR